MKSVLAICLVSAAFSSNSAQLFFNGPVAPSLGGFSVLTAPSTTFGFGAQTTQSNSVADDFMIAAGSIWNVQTIDLFAYQTGAVGFTFTGATWSVISGDINTGLVLASGTTTVSDGGVVGYRTETINASATNRAIYSVGLDVPDFSLGAGSYWLRWSLEGTALSGPWQPPTSDARAGNAYQLTADTAPSYARIVEDGSGQFVELPFALNGDVMSVSAIPEPEMYLLMLLGGLVATLAARKNRSKAK